MLNIKNPSITEKEISLNDYINSKKDFFRMSVEFGVHSPYFKCNYFNNEDIKVEGGLVTHPICELPKFGLFKNFWSHECNRFNLNISINNNHCDIDSKNELYKTSYHFNSLERKKIFGIFRLAPKKKSLGDWLYGNHISINNSNKEFINNFMNYIKDHKKPFVIDFVVQKIKEWSYDNQNYWPIIDLSLNYNYCEIIKDEYFDFSNTLDEFPRSYNILIKTS